MPLLTTHEASRGEPRITRNPFRFTPPSLQHASGSAASRCSNSGCYTPREALTFSHVHNESSHESPQISLLECATRLAACCGACPGTSCSTATAGCKKHGSQPLPNHAVHRRSVRRLPGVHVASSSVGPHTSTRGHQSGAPTPHRWYAVLRHHWHD